MSVWPEITLFYKCLRDFPTNKNIFVEFGGFVWLLAVRGLYWDNLLKKMITYELMSFPHV